MYCRIRNLFPGAQRLAFSLTTSFKYLENISIGDDVMIGPYFTLGAHSPIVIEDFVRISRGSDRNGEPGSQQGSPLPARFQAHHSEARLLDRSRRYGLGWGHDR